MVKKGQLSTKKMRKILYREHPKDD